MEKTFTEKTFVDVLKSKFPVTDYKALPSLREQIHSQIIKYNVIEDDVIQTIKDKVNPRKDKLEVKPNKDDKDKDVKDADDKSK